MAYEHNTSHSHNDIASPGFSPYVLTATILRTINHDWLIVSRASHHVTNDLATLSLHTPYNGYDTLTIGDGASLPISHIGSMILHTPSFSFVLSNVLYVPHNNILVKLYPFLAYIVITTIYS